MLIRPKDSMIEVEAPKEEEEEKGTCTINISKSDQI